MEHLLIQGGEQYLPFARSRIKALRATGLRYASQKFEVSSASIKVRIAGNESFITIDGPSKVKYQFFTTGATKTYTMSGFGFQILSGYSVKMSPTNTPVGSSIEASTATPPRWTYETDPVNITYDFPIQSIWQIEGIQEFAYYPKDLAATPTNKSGVAAFPFVVSCWGSVNPIHSVSILGGNQPDLSRYDMTYDIAPQVFKISGQAVGEGGGQGLAPDSDWYRRAAIRTVTHPTHGSRSFVIMVDASHVFTIYPVDVPVDFSLTAAADALWPGQAIKTDIASADVQSFATPFPAWVRVPTLSGRQWVVNNGGLGDSRWYVKNFPQYIWNFNSTATKACAVVHEDLPTYAFPTLGTKPTVDRMALAGQTTPNITEALPGMVEVNIDIQLTGALLNNWTASVTLGTVVRPTTSHQFVTAAGYTWNVAGEQNPATPSIPPVNVADLDDLVLVKGEVYYPTADRFLTGKFVYSGACRSILRVYNETKATTIRTFLMNSNNYAFTGPVADAAIPTNGWLAYSLLLAFDIRILAFAIQQRYIATDPSTTAVAGVGRVQVFAYNKPVLSTYLDPDSSLNTLLDAAHTVDVAGWVYYNPDDVGAFDTNTASDHVNSFYNTFACWYYANKKYEPHDTSAYYSWYGNYRTYGGSFNAGAYMYGLKIGQHIVMEHKAQFAVHPAGHWSLTTDPIINCGGSSINSQDPLDVATMKQIRIDILKVPGKKATTHLAAYNAAFKKNLRESDFLFDFTYVTSTAGNHTTGDYWTEVTSSNRIKGKATFLRAQHRSNPSIVLYFALDVYVYLAEDSTGAPLSAAIQAVRHDGNGNIPINRAHIDLRYPFSGSYASLPLIQFSGYITSGSQGSATYSLNLAEDVGAPSIILPARMPYTRGSAMFY